MLFNYIKQTQRLLQDPTQAIFNIGDLQIWINTARGQIAGEAECIRAIGTVSTVVAQREYLFSAINVGVPATTGIEAPINVRRINYGVASGQRRVTHRAWEWFELYYLNNPVPPSGAPKVWAQYAQGSAGVGTGSGASGSFYIDPLPDLVYTLLCDCLCYPAVLTTDATVEAIPYLWTDAVPYYAAYLGYMAAQQSDKAKELFSQYQLFVQRARKFSNPAVNRTSYEQESDPVQAAKLGLDKAGG